MDLREELLATLKAYAVVQQASWPALNLYLAAEQPGWGKLTDDQLKLKLGDYIRETEVQTAVVRVFWKLGPDYAFRGGNLLFARDAGRRAVSEMVGKTDFDPSFPWSPQAAKYRQDDIAIVKSGKPRLNIIERQTSEAGLTWLQTSKAPIVLDSGEAVGLLGMYGVIDRDTAVKLLR
jgi:hypothetical protein